MFPKPDLIFYIPASSRSKIEALIFCGAQASGKSSFFLERFFKSHVLISLDLMRTRRREGLFLETALKAGQRFVVDNTNPTREDRRRYVEAARSYHFKPRCYYFSSVYEELAERNSRRTGRFRVPAAAIKATLAKMETPSLDEGFEQIYQVSLSDGHFIVSEWNNEV